MSILNPFFSKYRYIIIFSVMLLVGFTKGNAQSIKFIKRQINFQRMAHIKDQEQFSFGGGIVSGGFNIDVGYGKYLKKDLLFRTDIIYENVKLGLTTLNAYYVSPEINYTINKIGNQFFIDIKAGAILGSENLRNSIMVNKKLSNFVFGEKIGMKFEYFITTEISMNLDVEQRFINNSQTGTISRNAYLSLSYNF